MMSSGPWFGGKRYVLLGGTAVAGLIAAALIVWLVAASPGEHTSEPAKGHEHGHAERGHAEHKGEDGQTQLYMCPMNCIDPRPEPGRCPICGMDLVPLPAGGARGEKDTPRLVMSESAMKLAEVRTATVERRFVDVELQLAGKVDYDETRVRTITARSAGRLERLYVDYNGVKVKEGDRLARLYSPDLVEAQSSLIIASTGVREKGTEGYPTRSSPELLEGMRHRLRQLGLMDEQIKSIEKTGKAIDTLDLHSPISGTVVRMEARQGMYVKEGTVLYTVADLSRVWVRLDAYESEIAWLRYGQEVLLETEVYGDETFQGLVSFIDPVLDPMTRTVRVRVVAENDDQRLKPNMFVRAVVKVRVADEGKVAAGGNLRGKWISPRHPEIVRDQPGKCPLCGIELARAEDLGYAPAGEARPPLVVPATAVLLTGRRGVVYVKAAGVEEPTFEGVEVELGPRAGRYYVVRSGLEEGQEVVTNGNFKIDSALQLMGKRSMMNPQGKAPAGQDHGHAH